MLSRNVKILGTAYRVYAYDIYIADPVDSYFDVTVGSAATSERKEQLDRHGRRRDDHIFGLQFNEASLQTSGPDK